MNRLAVFCGSKDGADPLFREAAGKLGRALAARSIGLVYGGSRVGTMGAVADATLAAKGQAIGVLPHFLQEKELAHPGLTELHLVHSMHERKAKMSELSDGFIILPEKPKCQSSLTDSSFSQVVLERWRNFLKFSLGHSLDFMKSHVVY